jgi:hypothetical protein
MLCRAAAINLEGYDFGGPPFFINGVKKSLGDRKKCRRVMLAGNLAHCLQKTLGTKTMREVLLKEISDL